MKHYSMDDLLSIAEDIGGGYSRATVTLNEGETVWAPGTTKKVLIGAGEYRFLFHPTSAYCESQPTHSRPVGMWR